MTQLFDDRMFAIDFEQVQTLADVKAILSGLQITVSRDWAKEHSLDRYLKDEAEEPQKIEPVDVRGRMVPFDEA